MQQPANDPEAAIKAAARWKRRSKPEKPEDKPSGMVEDLRDQIIATFRLQRRLAFQDGGGQPGTAADWDRRMVGVKWKDIFKDDPLSGIDGAAVFDFEADTKHEY